MGAIKTVHLLHYLNNRQINNHNNVSYTRRAQVAKAINLLRIDDDVPEVNQTNIKVYLINILRGTGDKVDFILNFFNNICLAK